MSSVAASPPAGTGYAGDSAAQSRSSNPPRIHEPRADAMSIDYTQRGETRRSFLKHMALFGGALAAGACSPGVQGSGSGAASAVRADRIGLQLYTVRDQM